MVSFVSRRKNSLTHCTVDRVGPRIRLDMVIKRKSLNPIVLEWQGCVADHSLPCSADVKNNGAIPPFTHASS
jgi:hypothetical protein